MYVLSPLPWSVDWPWWSKTLATQLSRPELHSNLWGHMKNLLYQQIVNTQDALLHCILDAATCVQDNPKKLLQTTYSIYGYARICIETKGGHFEHLL
jgi:hypothetical protein